MAFVEKLRSLLLCLMIIETASGVVVDYYCSKNTFGSNSTHLQLTKEVSTKEYAIIEQFKSLHCCAKGYRSIEWYKDGLAYPWATEISSFILYPEEANQTIYTQHSMETDKGNYTCILKNDTHTEVNTMIVETIDRSPTWPKTTYFPKDQWVELGQMVRLYCEAFVGRIILPDIRNDIYWKRVYPADSKLQNQNLPQEKITREDGQTIGSYLIINEIKSQDYGEYVCSVSNADSIVNNSIWLHLRATEIIPQDVSVPWLYLLMTAVLCIVVVLIVIILYLKVGRRVRLLCLETFSKYPKNDNKVYDALVLYTESTASSTLDWFIPTLQNKYTYECAHAQLPNNTTAWFDVASQLASLSRSVVTILNPTEFTTMQLTVGLIKLHAMSSNCSPILVCIKETPKIQPMPKNERGENLQILLNKTNVVVWKSAADKDFWLQLRLYLPRINSSHAVPENNTNISEESVMNTSTPIEFDEYGKAVKRNTENGRNDDIEMIV